MLNSGPVSIGLKWLNSQVTEDIPLPTYETSGSAGMDVCAAVNAEITIQPGQIKVIPTGFAVAIPAGLEIQVRPRSGLAINHGIAIVNAPGTIDSDYRGEVKIGLVNLSHKPYSIKRGDRIAQLVVAPVVRASFTVVGELDQTDRGSGGFGHTGLR
jgi:dUTP pyrophosphatase